MKQGLASLLPITLQMARHKSIRKKLADGFHLKGAVWLDEKHLVVEPKLCREAERERERERDREIERDRRGRVK